MTHLDPVYPLLVVAAGILLFRACRRAEPSRPRLAAVAVGLVFLYSWPPAAAVLSAPLECWYTTRALPEEHADAIVVLSGYVRKPLEEHPVPFPGRDTFTRCHYASWLERQVQVPVLVCGGSGRDRDDADRWTYASVMRDLLVQQGVASDQIWLEERSHSTHTNAEEARRILETKGIAKVYLVTEAVHMLRAELCFRKAGIDVVPAPCNFRVSNFEFDVRGFLPGHAAIRQNDRAVHEWLGLLWYLVRGFI